MKYRLTISCLILAIILSNIGCKKLLKEKPDLSIATIESISSLKAVLMHPNLTSFASLANIGSDQYLHSNSAYSAMTTEFQMAYRWDKNATFDQWSGAYRIVYAANVVLQELDRLTEGTDAERRELTGQALFLRAFSLYQLSQVYCAPYSEETKGSLGLPLRLTANVEERIYRSTLEETYKQIIEDIETAADFLPLIYSEKNLPGRLSCFGLMARIYLSMRKYDEAERYASFYLNEKNELLDFNDLDTLANPSIPSDNVESVFDVGLTPVSSKIVTIHPDLMRSYEVGDLRKRVLFSFTTDSNAVFKGSYYRRASNWGYGGIATDEIFLIRSECLFRRGELAEGLKDLNFLLSHRWKRGEFVPVGMQTKEELLDIVLTERNKELVFRESRWSDLRRLNLEGRQVGLSRTVEGVNYSLPPGDKRWIWLIPIDAIRLGGIKQNER